MPKSSPYPNHPIRVLRETLGFPSADAFATFVGIPAETIRNLEQGRRTVTDRVAMQIGIATLVSPWWLQVGNVARGAPVDPMGEPLTKEYLQSYASPKFDEDDPLLEHMIDKACFEAEALLRAAARRGRLRQASYFMILAGRDAQIHLNIEKEVREEMIKIDPEHPSIPPLGHRWKRWAAKPVPKKKRSSGRAKA